METNDLGTDINSIWQMANGDLVLIHNEDNMAQAILNRLQCIYDGLSFFYTDYGSSLSSFFGFKKSNETLEFIRIETEKALNQDPRLNDFSVECKYNGKGKVAIIIKVNIDEDTDFTLNLVINEDKSITILGDAVEVEEE